MLVYPSDLHGDPQGRKVLASQRRMHISSQTPRPADVQLCGFTIIERTDAGTLKSTDTSCCCQRV